MQNSDTLANENPQSSLLAHERRKKGPQERQAALDSLRLRLDTVTATVSRLERGLQERRAFWRPNLGEAAIIAAVLTLSGLLWITLLIL
jgi:hypothetical protein